MRTKPIPRPAPKPKPIITVPLAEVVARYRAHNDEAAKRLADVPPQSLLPFPRGPFTGRP